MKNEKISSTRYVKHRLIAKLIFIPSSKETLFKNEHILSIKETFTSICEQNDCSLLNLSNKEQFIELDIQFLPRTTLSILINSLKTVSSRKLRRDFIQFKKEDSVWNRKYLIVTLEDYRKEDIENFIKRENE